LTYLGLKTLELRPLALPLDVGALLLVLFDGVVVEADVVEELLAGPAGVVAGAVVAGVVAAVAAIVVLVEAAVAAVVAVVVAAVVVVASVVVAVDGDDIVEAELLDVVDDAVAKVRICACANVTLCVWHHATKEEPCDSVHVPCAGTCRRNTGFLQAGSAYESNVGAPLPSAEHPDCFT